MRTLNARTLLALLLGAAPILASAQLAPQLDDARAYETQDAVFYADLAGAQPMGYQWFRMYPWETNWVQVAGATNSTFAVTNIDS